MSDPRYPAPERRRVNGRVVAGIQVRTNNRAELDPDSSSLDRLWEGFLGDGMPERIPDRAAGSPVYGVYSDYQDGRDGDYSVLAGVEVGDERKVPEAYQSVVIEAGEYLVFHARGRFSDTVMETWSRVWRYFEREDAPPRRFVTDYEVYEGTDRLSIYVGVR